MNLFESVVWVAAWLCSFAAFWVLVIGVLGEESSGGQMVAATAAIGLAVIPYVFAQIASKLSSRK